MKTWNGLIITPHKSGQKISYTIDLGIGERGALFITNPTIREIIKKGGFEQARIGRVELNIFEGILTFKHFNPIGSNYEPQNKLFIKTGVASLIETRILRHVKETFPEIRIVRPNPSTKRLIQLDKRDKNLLFKHMNFIDFNIFNKATRQKLAKDLWKHRRR